MASPLPIPDLGRLTPMDLREVWQSESGDFTPWLARPENIALLGETIGLDLVVLAQEKEVGPFRADILCKDPTSEELILIENQLERTDHTHLGQILTYAAGLKTVTIIWVARRFTEEHRATLDWLNEITNEEFRFFGLEAEVWRIGDSAPAPKFNIVSQPNDWSRQVSNRAGKLSRGELTPSRQLQLEFWTAFSAFVEEGTYRFRTIKPGPQNWMTIAIGRSGFALTAVASLWDSEGQTYDSHEIRAEFTIYADKARAAFDVFHAERDTIDREIGETPEWYAVEGVRNCKVVLKQQADLNDRDQWPAYHRWLAERLDRLHQVFQDRVRNLDFGRS